MYHPVTTEYEKIHLQIKNLIRAVIESERQYINTYPNNDLGSDIIIDELNKIEGNSNFKISLTQI